MVPIRPLVAWFGLVLLFGCACCGLQYGLDGLLRSLQHTAPLLLACGIYAYWQGRR